MRSQQRCVVQLSRDPQLLEMFFVGVLDGFTVDWLAIGLIIEDCIILSPSVYDQLCKAQPDANFPEVVCDVLCIDAFTR